MRGRFRSIGRRAEIKGMVRTGIGLLRDQKYEEAVAVAEVAVALDPESYDALALLAEAYFQTISRRSATRIAWLRASTSSKSILRGRMHGSFKVEPSGRSNAMMRHQTRCGTRST